MILTAVSWVLAAWARLVPVAQGAPLSAFAAELRELDRRGATP